MAYLIGQTDSGGGSALSSLLGDSRRMFANQVFVKADAYFHGGYYPTIFDHAPRQETSHMQAATQETEAVGKHHETDHSEHANSHDEDAGFLGKPLDWIEAFGRNFFPSRHVHLETGNEQEILPWLKLSAQLDPEKVQTYTVSSFWLRTRLGRVKEAEDFLREGLRVNPNSYEILFELGRIYDENHHDIDHARTLYELALSKWQAEKRKGGEPDRFVYSQINLFLARLEERAENYAKAADYLERVKEFSPAKDILEKQIVELRAKSAASTAPKK